MTLHGTRLTLEPITPELARRIVERDERPGDAWHVEYPFADELAPLRSLGATPGPRVDTVFGLFVIRRLADGLAVGGLGFFGRPDEEGRVEFGYGLVPSARGAGLATEAVTLALEHARRHGARTAVADTEVANAASRRVLEKSGLTETGRRGSLVLYERDLSL
ncbi:GNAT family N-acetyltransferase [Frigoribacterium sp. 2-23]|uniref:GNAT family N-acetyltransferase n=1 Tax=Frigoribacterium sp. 2-23 TaxID=3415006 RepID=UPI003C701597